MVPPNRIQRIVYTIEYWLEKVLHPLGKHFYNYPILLEPGEPLRITNGVPEAPLGRGVCRVEGCGKLQGPCDRVVHGYNCRGDRCEGCYDLNEKGVK